METRKAFEWTKQAFIAQPDADIVFQIIYGCVKNRKNFFRNRFMTFNLARNVFLGASSFALETLLPRAVGTQERGEQQIGWKAQLLWHEKLFRSQSHANFIINILVEAEAGASPINILSPMNVKLLKSCQPEKSSKYLRSHSCPWCVPSCSFGVC